MIRPPAGYGIGGCRYVRERALKNIQSQPVARPASISTLMIFRACGDFWNGIERPHNDAWRTGGSASKRSPERGLDARFKAPPEYLPASAPGADRKHDCPFDRRRRGSPRAGEVKPIP